MVTSLQTDLATMERLAEENKEENGRFGALIDVVVLPSGELDAMVQRHYGTVSSQIDCRECGNCCRGVPPLLYQADVERLAAGLNMSTGDVTDRFLESCRNGLTFRINQVPCHFLSGNICTVYAHRPDICRSYPYLLTEGFSSRSRDAIANCDVCPIVFNVLEMLKAELRERFPREWEEMRDKGR